MTINGVNRGPSDCSWNSAENVFKNETHQFNNNYVDSFDFIVFFSSIFVHMFE